MSRKERDEILRIEHLSISFSRYSRGFRRRELHPVEDLSLKVRGGEIVAVVGSSGSGKSLLAHAVMGILPYNARVAGKLFYDGGELTAQRIRKLRGKEIMLVPQSVSYLDPLMRIGDQVKNGRGDPRTAGRCREVLDGYGLEREVESQYPFQLSGGMIRRVLISTAVMENPRLVIADEPTPGLHVEVAKRIMGHFREIADSGAGVLLITHDLELAIETADRVAVLYAGALVEQAAAEDFLAERVLHPYSRGLIRALPQNWNTGDGAPGVDRRAEGAGRFCETSELMRRMREEYGR